MIIKVNKTKTTAASASVNKENAKAEASADESRAAKKQKASRNNQFTERVEFAAALCLAQKYTDEQIIDNVNKRFPNYSGLMYNQREMGRARWMLRNDLLKGVKHENKPFDRLFDNDGELVTRENKPKKARAPKVSKEDDPLNTVAGIDVHDKKEPVKKTTAKKEPVKKTTAKKEPAKKTTVKKKSAKKA